MEIIQRLFVPCFLSTIILLIKIQTLVNRIQHRQSVVQGRIFMDSFTFFFWTKHFLEFFFLYYSLVFSLDYKDPI